MKKLFTVSVCWAEDDHPLLVSSAAVIRDVTQRFSPTKKVGGGGGEALRDDPKYLLSRSVQLTTNFSGNVRSEYK